MTVIGAATPSLESLPVRPTSLKSPRAQTPPVKPVTSSTSTSQPDKQQASSSSSSSSSEKSSPTTSVTEHSGTIFIPLPDGSGLLQELKGQAMDPSPMDNLKCLKRIYI
jgi:hypothetical protein